MKTFKQFISEGGYNVPVVTVNKWKNDLSNPETIDEINKNLSISLSRGFSDVREGLQAAKKILSMYGIELPRIDFHNKNEGEEKVEVNQHNTSGEDTDGTTADQKKTHIFSFKYELKDGKFSAEAKLS